MQPSDALSFNNGKHSSGDWDTALLTCGNGPLRAAAGYLSAKRRGVTRLADVVPRPRFVLDAGAGNGAYTIWFLARTPCTVVSVDISRAGLRKIVPAHAASGANGRALPVCADLCALPFRDGVFGAVFSVDTLGHVADVDAALGELARTGAPGAALFLHSECADYRLHWPDGALIARLEADLPAQRDGHQNLRTARKLRELYSRRFKVLSFVNPAGRAGWFLGYPEKYRDAFRAAGWKLPFLVTRVFAAVKRFPVLGIAMRVVNATTNHVEIMLGLSGGGSCFAFLRKFT